MNLNEWHWARLKEDVESACKCTIVRARKLDHALFDLEENTYTKKDEHAVIFIEHYCEVIVASYSTFLEPVEKMISDEWCWVRVKRDLDLSYNNYHIPETIRINFVCKGTIVKLRIFAKMWPCIEIDGLRYEIGYDYWTVLEPLDESLQEQPKCKTSNWLTRLVSSARSIASVVQLRGIKRVLKTWFTSAS